MQSERNKLNSIEKALSILKVFDSNRPYWGVREISSHLGFSPSTVQRLLQTLKDYSYVEQNPETRQYRLGNIYFQFIFTLQNASPLTETAQLFMRQLLSKTQETVHLNVIDGTERLCIDSIESSQSLKASMPIGSRSPLYAGASSKCLLAYSESDFVKQYLKTTKIKAILCPLWSYFAIYYNVCVYKGTMMPCNFCNTVEPRFNEVAGDRPNLFVKWRVRYIENLDKTNLRGNNQNVRYIEVIVND